MTDTTRSLAMGCLKTARNSIESRLEDDHFSVHEYFRRSLFVLLQTFLLGAPSRPLDFYVRLSDGRPIDHTLSSSL